MAPKNESTEDVLRAQIRVLIDLGIPQRTIAGRLDVHESWFSRWLRRKPTRAIDVNEMDRFRAYVNEFRERLDRLEETKRESTQRKR